MLSDVVIALKNKTKQMQTDALFAGLCYWTLLNLSIYLSDIFE